MHQDNPRHLWYLHIYIYIFTHLWYMSLHFTVQERCPDWEHQALDVITEDGIDNGTVLFVFCSLFSLQVVGQSIVMPSAGSYSTSHSLYIKDGSHLQRSFFITKSEIRSQAVAYPHLNMSLQLKSIYTRAELEQRCKNAKRRRHVKKRETFSWSISNTCIYIYIYVASVFRMFYGQRRVGKSYSI